MNSRSSLHLTFFSVFIFFIFPLSGASNSFEDDPPNAAILINDEIFDIQLTSIEVSDSKVKFLGKKNKIDGKEMLEKGDYLDGKIYVFIDETSWVIR